MPLPLRRVDPRHGDTAVHLEQVVKAAQVIFQQQQVAGHEAGLLIPQDPRSLRDFVPAATGGEEGRGHGELMPLQAVAVLAGWAGKRIGYHRQAEIDTRRRPWPFRQGLTDSLE